MFLFVNVDKHKPIPPNVDRVPYLMLPDKTSFVNDELFAYIEKLSQSLNNENVNAYFDNEMGNGISDSFSYIDDNQESSKVERSFSMINTDFMIPTPKEDEFRTSKTSSEMDKLKIERENELKQYFNHNASAAQQPRNFVR